MYASESGRGFKRLSWQENVSMFDYVLSKKKKNKLRI